MGKIVLKTGRRRTTVSRKAIRQAVKAAYSIPLAEINSPEVKTKSSAGKGAAKTIRRPTVKRVS